MKKFLFVAALIAVLAVPGMAQDNESLPVVATGGDPLTTIVSVLGTIIVGAIVRGIEKRRLRKKGKLVDKPQE